jgi:hypothetical protein
MVKAYYMRRYMADKGILPELSDLTSKDDDGQPMINVIDETSEHLEAVIRSCVKIISKTKDMANAADKDLEKLGSDENTSDSGTDLSTSPDDDAGGEDLSEGDDLIETEPADEEGENTKDDVGEAVEEEPELEEEPIPDK